MKTSPERLIKLSKLELDCGDNSCSFAKNKGGMRTNGGCRCIENALYRPVLGEIKAALKAIPGLIEDLLQVNQDRSDLLVQLEQQAQTCNCTDVCETCQNTYNLLERIK